MMPCGLVRHALRVAVSPLAARCLSREPSTRPKLPALGDELRALLARYGGAAALAVAPVMEDAHVVSPAPLNRPGDVPTAVAGEPPAPTGVTVDAARVFDVMQSHGIDDDLCDAAAGVLMDEYSDRVDVALLPRVMRAAGVPAVHILHTVCDVMQVGVESAPAPTRGVIIVLCLACVDWWGVHFHLACGRWSTPPARCRHPRCWTL